MWMLLLISVQLVLVWSQVRIEYKNIGTTTLGQFLAIMLISMIPILGIVIFVIALLSNIENGSCGVNSDKILDRLLMINRNSK